MQHQCVTHASSPLKTEISNLKTTLIGDYVSVVFPEYHPKWLVQAFGNAMLKSTLDGIIKEKIMVNRKYMFIQLGGNHIRSTTKDTVFKEILSVVIAIRDKNAEAWIFVVAVLPRLVENDNVKPYIVVFNHWLRNATECIMSIFSKVKFIPAQLSFLGPVGPCLVYFAEDQLKLNELGLWVFQDVLFHHAGFIKNNG